MKDPALSTEEKQCFKDCLVKFNQMERFMVEKVHKSMQTLVMQDPNLRQAYLDQQNKAKTG